MDCSMPGFPVFHYLLEFSQIHIHWIGDAILPSYPLSSPSPPALNFSQHQGLFQCWVFTSGGQNIGASASVLPVNIQDWFPLGLTGLLSLQSKELSKESSQYHNLKVSIIQHSAFFIVWLSHLYMTTGKTTALAIWIFVSKMIFNMLSRLVIAFFPRNKRLLISWLQSPSAVILELPQNKVCHFFHWFPIYLPWSDGTGCHDLSFLNVELKTV